MKSSEMTRKDGTCINSDEVSNSTLESSQAISDVFTPLIHPAEVDRQRLSEDGSGEEQSSEDADEVVCNVPNPIPEGWMELFVLPLVWTAGVVGFFLFFIFIVIPTSCVIGLPAHIRAWLGRAKVGEEFMSMWRVSDENRNKMEELAAAEHPGITLCDSRVIKRDGTPGPVIHYVTAGSEEDISESRPPVLVVHGSNSTALAMAPTLEYFASQGRFAIAVDSPCWGRSEGCSRQQLEDSGRSPTGDAAPHHQGGHSGVICDLIVDVIAAFVHQRFGGRRIVVTGHSFGGMTVQRFGMRHPDLCECVVAVAPAATLRSSGRYGALVARAFQIGLFPRFVRQFGSFGLWAVYGGLPLRPLHRYELQCFARSDNTADTIIRGFVEQKMFGAYSRWTEARLPDIMTMKVPYSTVWGENDELCPASHGAVIAEATESPVFVVKDCAHSLQNAAGLHAMTLAIERARIPSAAARAPAVKKLLKARDAWSTYSLKRTLRRAELNHLALRTLGRPGHVSVIDADLTEIRVPAETYLTSHKSMKAQQQ